MKSNRELLAVCIVSVAVGVITWLQTARHFQAQLGPSELHRLEFVPMAKYLPSQFSRENEETIIRDFFEDRRGGVFLDVGSNHYRNDSNTFYLESVLGWSGVAIDALPEFGPDYVAHRPRTRFVSMFASDTVGDRVRFFVPTDQPSRLVASGTQEVPIREGFKAHAIEVPTTTLNAVLDEAGIKALDFMSMDIELAEPKALAGFDIDRFRPALVCIEAHSDVRQQILDYFQQHDYVVIGKYLRADLKNLYFRPAAKTMSPAQP
jgi:FkbM family methyltransferase